MKKSNILFGLTVAMAAGFTACSNDDSFDENYGKEAIAFSSYVNNCPSITAKTRAVGEITAFTAKTQIAMSISSETTTSGVIDATKTAANTRAYVEAKTGSEDRTKVTFTDDEKRYWDDLWGREAQLTVYAAGVEGKTIDQVKGTGTPATNVLDLGTENKMDWTLSTTQTTNTYALEDLLISNNVKKTSDKDDARMKYNSGFPTGNLVFTHATTKITLNLIKGEGYGDNEFTNPTVTYNGFYNVATYNVTDGSVTISGNPVDITPIKPTAATTTNDSKTMFTYNALVVPSRNWDAKDASNVFTIVTDNNTYYVKTSDFNNSSSLTNKLTGEMLAGNQYIFNVTINKSGIKVTASLINWIPNNTALTPIIIEKGDIGNNFDKDEITQFDLYRSMAVGSGYGSKECTCTGTKKDGYTMDKQIYWPNHEDAYFFRAISAYGEDGKLVSTFPTYVKGTASEDGVQPEYIEVSTCQTVEGKKVKDGMDVVVGAPYEKDALGGIGALTGAKKATDGNINFTFMHVMSQVYVQLKTTEGPDAVDLSGATVEILNTYTNGQVNASDNKISATGDKTDGYSLGNDLDGTDGKGTVKLPGEDTETSGTNVYRGYTVPQSLSSGTDKVQIKVTTKDGNTYFVDASTTDITSWVSGNQYLYNLTLKKTGIVLTASLVDWKTGKVIDLGVKL